MTTYELETLFIEKLTEKYDLTERSIKKAFSRFDADGNGLLNLNELVAGFEAFLNGVDHKQVQALVFSYDVNGDGVISFEEFFQFLTNRQGKQNKVSGGGGGRARGGGGGGEGGGGRRAARQERERRAPPPRQRQPSSSHRSQHPPQRFQAKAPPQNMYTHDSNEYQYEPSEQSIPDDGMSSMRDEYSEQDRDSEIEMESASLYSYSQPDDTRSELSSVFDPTIGNAVESRVKIFTEALKSFLYQEAMKMRRDNKIANSHQITFHNLSDTVSRSLLERAFQREANRSGGRDDELMNLKSFCK